MTTAQATMVAHSGDWKDSHTPSGDVNAPPKPAATPSRTTQEPLRIWLMTPDMDVGMMVKREVAVAPKAGSPKPSLNTGTRIVPPPMPSIPESTPTPKPTKRKTIAEPRKASKDSGVLQVEPDLTGSARVHVRFPARHLRLFSNLGRIQ